MPALFPYRADKELPISRQTRISHVPTHIITGFLGAGKTSAILHLLKAKPADERWAVLVNEFGEIGVDGSLFAGQLGEAQGVFVSEVPGGCMCCTAHLPMQVALNRLLRRARPDRLLIEPTGLGHPREVSAVLSGEFYKETLSIQKIVTLVDARQLSDPRYTGNETFNQQIGIADLVVGNKADLYSDTDRDALTRYVASHGAPQADITITEQGALDLAVLQGTTGALAPVDAHAHQHEHAPLPLDEPVLPPNGMVKVQNQGEGFQSVGWRFGPERVFDRLALRAFLTGLTVERMKAVFITEEGTFAYNATPDGLTEFALTAADESRVEMIATEIDPAWETQLLDCLPRRIVKH